MGEGQQYLIDLAQWLSALTRDARQAYVLSLTIPKEWMDWACIWYAYPDDDDEAVLDAAWEALSRRSAPPWW
jgi:hypothetical protein